MRNNDWHNKFAKIRGEFKEIHGKLEIHKYYNQVAGNRLSVTILSEDGTAALKVYGNYGHRDCGWIHYSEKIEVDLGKIFKEMLDK